MDFNVVKHMVDEFFNGQYEVRKFLGEGSFAEVYLVNHNYLDDLRAMKIIKEPLGSASNVKKVFHEVMLATQLRHENIISIYDAGIISTFGRDDDGRFSLRASDGTDREDWAYFIMEYVQGGDLDQYMKSFINSNIDMPISRALDITRQILLGLNTLHSSNPTIVHRDLKPNNILLSFNSKGDIVIKISDFGFAKEVSTSDIDVEIAGNKNYMAPECYRKIFSTKTDIYAVGVIFYQMLTGHCPYDINRFSLLEVLDDRPWRQSLNLPSHHRSEIPDYIDEVVARCLAVDPAGRYSNAMELLRDVENCIDRYSREIDESVSYEGGDDEVYSEYIINDSIRRAFHLAKCENGLGEAIEILESEILSDYDIRKCYSSILRVWKSRRPDVKLVSQAFSVNLKGNNYKLSCNYLKEAIAYNPSIKDQYQPYLDLWDIFSDLKKYGNLIKAVLSLEELMETNAIIHDEYINVISTLKTFSAEEILNESLRLANLNSLSDAAKLMEFAVVADNRIRAQYAYKLSLLKQNIKIDFLLPTSMGENTIDFAIDLGTTDSVISYYNSGNPIVIKNHNTGEDFTPSAVLIDEDESIQVGEKARQAIIENSDDAVSEFKNDMGFSIPFRFGRSSQVMLPEELSAEVLKDLRKSVYYELGENVEHIVITVPANSNPMKTRAVNDAADLAGFRSHYLILEPVAVSLAYGLHEAEHGKIWMIYDLGGATFNVSLITNNHGEIQKIDSIGVDTLGGNLFDWKIVDELLAPKIIGDLSLEDFKRAEKRYVREFSLLKKAAERAKIELTAQSEARIFIENLFDGYDFEYLLTVEEFKDIISGPVEYSMKLCRDLLEANSIEYSDVSKIILVGGSSLSSIVQKMIFDEFGIELECRINPLTVVARGAAIYAGSLEKPAVDTGHGCFSVILKSHMSGISGRVFNDDSKFSFLGYSIEFKGDDLTSGRVPVNIDGVFSADLKREGQYQIVIYDNDGNPVEIDVKSPGAVRFITDSHDFEMDIPFFGQSFTNSFYGDATCDDLVYRFNGLIESLDELSDYYTFSEVNENYVLDYLSDLMELLSKDASVANQASIYLDYMTDKLKDMKRDLELVIFVENIENKIAVVEQMGYFSVDEIKTEFSKAIKDRDLERLNGIYHELLERYVSLNTDEVITTCFFNLRYEGIFTKNQVIADELVRNALKALKSSDFREVFNITKRLYELDERNID